MTDLIARMTRHDAVVLAHFAAGETLDSIVAATGLPRAKVTHLLYAVAENDRQRASGLAAAWRERAEAVAAARGARAPAPLLDLPAGAGPTAEHPATAPTDEDPADGPAGQPTGDIAALLARAVATGVPRLVRAAGKIGDLVAQLGADLARHEDTARLRAEEEQLTARLAEIRAQLSPKRAAAAAPAPAASISTAAADSRSIRLWAEGAGVDCPPRGRIPGRVIAAYLAARRKEGGPS